MRNTSLTESPRLNSGRRRVKISVFVTAGSESKDLIRARSEDNFIEGNGPSIENMVGRLR